MHEPTNAMESPLPVLHGERVRVRGGRDRQATHLGSNRSLLDHRQQVIQHAIEVIEDVIVVRAKYAKAIAHKIGRARAITLEFVNGAVRCAINLHDNLVCTAQEVDVERANRRLANELKPAQLPVSQFGPNQILGARRIRSKRTRAICAPRLSAPHTITPLLQHRRLSPPLTLTLSPFALKRASRERGLLRFSIATVNVDLINPLTRRDAAWSSGWMIKSTIPGKSPLPVLHGERVSTSDLINPRTLRDTAWSSGWMIKSTNTGKSPLPVLHGERVRVRGGRESCRRNSSTPTHNSQFAIRSRGATP